MQAAKAAGHPPPQQEARRKESSFETTFVWRLQTLQLHDTCCTWIKHPAAPQSSGVDFLNTMNTAVGVLKEGSDDVLASQQLAQNVQWQPAQTRSQPRPPSLRPRLEAQPACTTLYPPSMCTSPVLTHNNRASTLLICLATPESVPLPHSLPPPPDPLTP